MSLINLEKADDEEEDYLTPREEVELRCLDRREREELQNTLNAVINTGDD